MPVVLHPLKSYMKYATDYKAQCTVVPNLAEDVNSSSEYLPSDSQRGMNFDHQLKNGFIFSIKYWWHCSHLGDIFLFSR